MRENGEKETAVSTFILKISRKLRDCYLSGPAEGKVTYGTIFFFFTAFVCVCLCVCAWANFMGKIELQVNLHRNSRDRTGRQDTRFAKQTIFCSVQYPL